MAASWSRDRTSKRTICRGEGSQWLDICRKYIEWKRRALNLPNLQMCHQQMVIQTLLMSFSVRAWTFLLAQVWLSAVISARYTWGRIYLTRYLWGLLWGSLVIFKILLPFIWIWHYTCSGDTKVLAETHCQWKTGLGLELGGSGIEKVENCSTFCVAEARQPINGPHIETRHVQMIAISTRFTQNVVVGLVSSWLLSGFCETDKGRVSQIR